ncbi:MAG: hypothetical protein IPP93_04475 [Chitinophagaceae bacterium]|nr:hypothetical protein [Chitinophagaceae bacterium]
MKKLAWLLSCMLLMAACGRFGKKESGAKGEQRIVCLSKQLTEMMFAIGEGHNIVACDLSSTFSRQCENAENGGLS